MWNQKPSFRFEIDKFSEKEAVISSPTFVSGGCEWYLSVYPKGASLCDDHLSLFLIVANSNSLGSGWKRSATFYFVVLNQSEKELYKSFVPQYAVFQANSRGLGFRTALPLSKLQEKGFLEKGRFIIEVYIQIIEAFDGEGRDVPEKKETVDINGFQVFASQVTSARKMFAAHSDIAEDLKPKNKVVKTEYMNVLLNLIETLDKPSQNHSETELNNAYSELNELMEMGFKLDWLKSKLDEVSLKSKKEEADGFQVQQLNERVKTIELMELDFKLECLKKKLEDASLERKKSDDADKSWLQQLEERLKNLEVMVMKNLLNSKLEEVSLDLMKKSDDADESSRVQQLEESVKDLKKMLSDLKVELDKEKAKSSADDFLLVDEVA